MASRVSVARDDGEVVRHLERPETGRTDVGQADRLGQAAVATGHAGDAVRGRTSADDVGELGVGGRQVSVVLTMVSGRRRGAARGPVRTDDPDRVEGAPKSSLISQEDLPGIGTLPASRR